MNFDFNSLYPSHIDFSTDPYDWGVGWQKKFAWIPTKFDNGERIWLKHYYCRVGVHKFAILGANRIYRREHATIFDVLARA